MKKLLAVVLILAGGAVMIGCNKNRYEVIERADVSVPGDDLSPAHQAVDYVLLHNGRKIHASCDYTTVDKLDPNAGCTFRPLKTYECFPPKESDKALSDLKCTDGNWNVYLYVTKVEP